MEDIGKRKVSEFASYKKIKDQIIIQRTMKNKKERESSLSIALKGIVIGLFLILILCMSVMSFMFLFKQTLLINFMSKLVIYRMSRALLNITYLSGFIVSTGICAWLVAFCLENFYSAKIKIYSVSMGFLILAGASVGVSMALMQIISVIFGIDYGNKFAAVGILASISVFITSLVVTLAFTNIDRFLIGKRDIDKATFRIKGEGELPDKSIDVIETPERFIDIMGSASDNKQNDIYKYKIEKQKTGGKNIKNIFVAVMVIWAVAVISPLAIPIILYTPSVFPSVPISVFLKSSANLFMDSSILMKFVLFLLVGGVNWIFSVFVHCFSFFCGAILGDARIDSNTQKENMLEKISLVFSDIVVERFKVSFIITTTNLVHAIWNFPFELFKKPNFFSLDHRMILKKLFPPINFVISVTCVMFSGIIAFFSAFKQFKLGMYSIEQLRTADISVFDKDWESYMLTCTIIFSILMAILITFALVSFSWCNYDPVAMEEFYTKILQQMDIFSLHTWICLLYLFLMTLFVIIPSTVEILGARQSLARDLIIDKIITAA